MYIYIFYSYTCPVLRSENVPDKMLSTFPLYLPCPFFPSFFMQFSLPLKDINLKCGWLIGKNSLDFSVASF